MAYERYHEVLDDPATRKFISAVAYHGYDFKNYDKIAELERKYSEFPFWMDELCYAYEASYPTNKMLPIYEFDVGNSTNTRMRSHTPECITTWRISVSSCGRAQCG